MFYSPLRYPGGKNKLSEFIAKICIDSNINGHYVEPYCGGASVALFLLFEGYVNHITINDKDRSIHAFWHCVLNKPNELIKLIRETEVSAENWKIQKEVQNRKATAPLIELGFSTLFLNRTNRSGVIKGGMIGGKAQDGEYKIDCRFNKDVIIKKIIDIANRSNDISLRNEDALLLIDNIELAPNPTNTIIYFDPPYYLKADSLYMNYYKELDHKIVSERIKAIQNVNWIVSYDNHEVIRNLYKPYLAKEYSFNHSAHSARQGQEILFFSSNINEPDIPEYNPVHFKLKVTNYSKSIIYKPAKKLLNTAS